jgi:hypothetical protein
LIGDKASVAVAEALGYPYITIARSPIADLKAIKNEKEVEGFRASHVRDGSALVRYFAWLEEQLNSGSELSESQGADQLEKFRGWVSLYLVGGEVLTSCSCPESFLYSKACRSQLSPRLGPTQVCGASVTIVMSSVLRDSDHPLLARPK